MRQHSGHATVSPNTNNASDTPDSSSQSPHRSHQIYDIDDAEDAFELQSIAPTEDLNNYDDTKRHDRRSAEGASLLPSPSRFSVNSARSYEMFTLDEEKQVLKKLDRRLVLFMALLYCLSFLDRSSMSLANRNTNSSPRKPRHGESISVGLTRYDRHRQC